MKPWVPISYDPAKLDEVPWGDFATIGTVHSLDGSRVRNFSALDVERVLAYGDSGAGWDGSVAGLALLRWGQYLAWESWWGPTGSGFHSDAYGGDQEVMVALDPVVALRAIPENKRELLVFATDESERALVDVLFDAHMSGTGRAGLIEVARESGEFGVLVEFRVDELLRRWPEPETA